MVFPSVPLYLDPPNWQQHPNNQQQVLQGNGSGGGNDQNQHHLMPQPQIPQQPPQHQVGMGGGAQAMRPNSMAERARLAKIPPPEAPLKCPRCESTNTKFCYFNNYSLTQPRHFCKTCRRYWTRGGALRNVPVGGGCRRNKRSSGKTSSGGGGGGSSSKSSLSSPGSMVGGERIPLHMDLVSTSGIGHTLPGMPSAGGGTGMSSFMASLQNIAQLGMGNLGLTFGGALNAPPPHPLGGLGGLAGGGAGGGGSGGSEQHHHHHQLDFPQQLNNPNSTNHHHHQQQVQFPNFLGGFEIPGSSAAAGLQYTSSFQNDHNQGMEGGGDHDEQGNNSHQLPKSCSSQLAPVKSEDDGQQRLNLAKQFMGISSSSDHNNSNNATSNQYWGGNNMGNNNNNNNNNNNTAAANSMWTDLSGLNSSSTSHLL